jgi:hypothetical protein
MCTFYGIELIRYSIKADFFILPITEYNNFFLFIIPGLMLISISILSMTYLIKTYNLKRNNDKDGSNTEKRNKSEVSQQSIKPDIFLAIMFIIGILIAAIYTIIKILK